MSLTAHPKLSGTPLRNLHEGRGGIRDGRPEDWLTLSTGYRYPAEDIREDEHDVIHRFLETIYPSDEVRRYVLGSIWKCLNGEIPRRDHALFLLTGCGGNGKSAFLNWVKRMLGQYCEKVPITMLCQKRASHTTADPHLYNLKGRRFVYSSEPDSTFNDRLNGSLVKEISGGEEVSARPLYGIPKSFRPQFYLFIMANDSLALDGRDGGIARRLKVIRHVSRFVRNLSQANLEARLFPQDDTICKAVEILAPKFMRLLLGAHPDDFGTGAPEEIVQWTEAYLGERNIVKCFVQDCLEPGEAADFVTLSTLREAFRNWARENGGDLGVQLKLQELKAALVTELGDIKSTKWSNNTLYKNVFVGWKRRVQDDP